MSNTFHTYDGREFRCWHDSTVFDCFVCLQVALAQAQVKALREAAAIVNSYRGESFDLREIVYAINGRADELDKPSPPVVQEKP